MFTINTLITIATLTKMKYTKSHLLAGASDVSPLPRLHCLIIV